MDQAQMQVVKSNRYKFIEWMDLDNNGVLTECAIMKRLANGDVYYFTLNSLDSIDKQRLRTILQHKSTSMYSELWNVLEQHTLGNGINALIYFNQLVKVKTQSGQTFNFGEGRVGAGVVQQPTISKIVKQNGQEVKITEKGEELIEKKTGIK